MAGFGHGAAFGAGEITMTSTCLSCGTRLDSEAAVCSACIAGSAASLNASEPARRLPNIPVAAILAIGVLGALAVGSGKVALGHPATADAAVTASVDGKPVAVGGPAIALLEHQFAAKSQQGPWQQTQGKITKPRSAEPY